MNEPYTPPEMPPFPSTYEGVMATLAPYTKEQRPLDFFFEMYIVHVIEKLPADTLTALCDFSMKHPALFSAHGGDWQKYVVDQLTLSDNIDVAIWDL